MIENHETFPPQADVLPEMPSLAHAPAIPEAALPTGGVLPARSTETRAVGASLMQIPVTLQVVIGTARVPISRLAQLEPGSIVNLDEKLGSSATIIVNGREVARGNLFVMEGGDGTLGITITEVVEPAATAG